MLCSNSRLHVASYVFCMYFSFCMWASSSVAAYMSSMDVHTGTSTDGIYTCIHARDSWSLSSVWLFLDIQSVMYKSGSGLSIMQTLHWCICSIICCNCWNNMAISLLRIATNGLVISNDTHFNKKTVMMELL